ncbi:uncharacterized protein BCR38DRAFT_437951 [Pseudomassariella vexata]|uniref:2EXR domain-containing protein n=1 Tax=Pseudomassariella vexata TaxID=1141098 RepID=A0A1Y2DSY1_9PEZI|nr:uncharacterized protein BCR38DRAFT_437951 [Pseudomassariella vexata]ORY62254.1 hypothetical protein BCR38DRAFT_437951 [Pseudomassariella vexata]
MSKLKTLSEFTCFPRLPPEIRQLIWQFAIPIRVFEIDYLHATLGPSESGCSCDRPAWPLPAPRIARVCREARHVSQILGGWRLLEAKDYGFNITGRWTWFDSGADTLCVYTWNYRNRPNSNDARYFNLHAFCQTATNICVGLSSLTWDPLPMPLFFAFRLGDRKLWPRLANYMFFNDTIHLHLPPEAIRTQTLFTEGSYTALVDIRDTKKLKQCQELWDQHCLGHANATRRWMPEITPNSFPGILNSPERAEEYARRQHDRLRNIWLHAHYSALLDGDDMLQDRTLFKPDSIDPSKPRFLHHHPWARKTLAKMPDYRLVIVVRMCKDYIHDASHLYRKNEMPERRVAGANVLPANFSFHGGFEQ